MLLWSQVCQGWSACLLLACTCLHLILTLASPCPPPVPPGGNNGNNNGRGAGFGGNNNGDANSSNNGGNGPAFQPSLMSALGLAAALAVVSLGPLPASASALQRVVPTLQQRQQAKKVQAKKVQQEDETGPIYHGQVQLSERERRMLSRRQLHFREVIRAERV